MKIENRKIGAGQPAFLVAELSANHSGKLDVAKKTIEAAKAAGADAIKLQAYTPTSMTIDVDSPAFRVGPGTPWEGRSLFDLYVEAHTPLEWHEPLKQLADDLDLVFFSTAFDPSAVAFLEELGVPVHKIASFEIVDLPLIEHMGRTGKPMIISTGMASLEEIREAVDAARNGGAKDIVLLRCTSAYPSPPEAMHLRSIPHLAATFNVPVGLSDHTKGHDVPTAATALGACMIEKHLTLSRSEGGPDASFSLEPQEFASMVKAVRTVEKALGSVRYGVRPEEQDSLIFRRSLFVVEDVAKGEIFTQRNVRSIRPGHGLPPKFTEQVLGSKAKHDLERGTPITWEVVDRLPPTSDTW